MTGPIGDINQGIVGISHTTGSEQIQMPEQKMDKPSPGNKIIIHTESALNLADSNDHIMRFIRGNQLESYSPREQKEIRRCVLQAIQENKEIFSQTDKEAFERLKRTEALVKNDEILESMAQIARNILISA